MSKAMEEWLQTAELRQKHRLRNLELINTHGFERALPGYDEVFKLIVRNNPEWDGTYLGSNSPDPEIRKYANMLKNEEVGIFINRLIYYSLEDEIRGRWKNLIFKEDFWKIPQGIKKIGEMRAERKRVLEHLRQRREVYYALTETISDFSLRSL